MWRLIEEARAWAPAADRSPRLERRGASLRWSTRPARAAATGPCSSRSPPPSAADPPESRVWHLRAV
jgi:hypothetical protein